MKSVSTALLGAGLLLLGACGGGEEANSAANNSADTLSLENEDVLAPTDNGLEGTTDANLAVDANALGNSADLNAADANLSVDANASVNSQ